MADTAEELAHGRLAAEPLELERRAVAGLPVGVSEPPASLGGHSQREVGLRQAAPPLGRLAMVEPPSAEAAQRYSYIHQARGAPVEQMQAEQLVGAPRPWDQVPLAVVAAETSSCIRRAHSWQVRWQAADSTV